MELSLGFALKEKRKNLTQIEFANILNISVNKLRNIEQNKQLPDLKLLIKICHILKIEPDYLLDLPTNNTELDMHFISLGNALIYIRVTILKISKEQFADSLNISISTLSKYESNNRIPPLERIRELCEKYNISANFILLISY